MLPEAAGLWQRPAPAPPSPPCQSCGAALLPGAGLGALARLHLWKGSSVKNREVRLAFQQIPGEETRLPPLCAVKRRQRGAAARGRCGDGASPFRTAGSSVRPSLPHSGPHLDTTPCSSSRALPSALPTRGNNEPRLSLRQVALSHPSLCQLCSATSRSRHPSVTAPHHARP